MKESKKFTLNNLDWQKMGKNALIFLAPALLVLFADIAKALPNWFEGYYLVIAVYILNLVTDFVRKFVSGK